MRKMFLHVKGGGKFALRLAQQIYRRARAAKDTL